MRILLDTVTVSELRRGARADPGVHRWQESLSGEPTPISVITLNEIRYGIRKVEGRDDAFGVLLTEWYATLLSHPDRFPLLPVDRGVAELAADLRALYGTPYNDALIGATASVYGLTLATRDVADFEACGVPVVNPWEF